MFEQMRKKLQSQDFTYCAKFQSFFLFCCCLISLGVKQVHFWNTDSNRKWAVFTFNLPSQNHIHIAKYLFSIRNEHYEYLGDNTFLARITFKVSEL